MKRRAAVLALLVLLAACGQTGPLVLPEDAARTPPRTLPDPLGDEREARDEPSQKDRK